MVPARLPDRALRLFTLMSASLVLLVAPGSGLETVRIGADGDLDWLGEGTAAVTTIQAQHQSLLDGNKLIAGNAPGDLVEFDNDDFSGAILPKRILSGDNVANGTLERGGIIGSPNVFDFSGTFKPLDLQRALEELITPGGEQEAFERKDLNSLGILVILDLGGRFGVERIRFYPRNTVQPSPATPFENDFLRSFELFVNDGLALSQADVPIWGQPVIDESDNKNPVVEVILDPPQYVQHVRLRSTSTISFEIDEFEVFGIGYLATATYVSDIYDAGQPAVWGQLSWIEQVLGDPRFSSVRIRTRTGSDDDPFVFTRILNGQINPEEIPLSVDDPTAELGLDEYRQLPKIDAQGRQWNAGPVKQDLINWSPFSTPFPAEAANGDGVPITSPSPRRYMQMLIEFDSNDLDAARAIESLQFELLKPPLADGLIAEVFPREVNQIGSVPLEYSVLYQQSSTNLLGFDRLVISTPLRVTSIDEIQLLDATGQEVASRQFTSLTDTVDQDGFHIVSVDEQNFEVQFPRVQQDGSVVRIRFQSDVLTYSTNFTSSAKLSTEPGATQPVDAGDTGDLGLGDDPDLSGTTVLSPALLRGRLLDQVRLQPNPFSPNGDGINDEMQLGYSLLSLGAPRPVEIGIYDLSGRQVRVLAAVAEANGRYEGKGWDGRDESGQLVPPGLYVLRIAVEGDSRGDEMTQVVAVVY
jgi:hypothetical protein